jgi:hypothetical protein
MTPTTKLAPAVSIASWKGVASGDRQLSQFVVAIPRDSDRPPMRARLLEPWAKFLLLLLLVVLLMVLALVAFAVAQQGGKGVGAARVHPGGLFRHSSQPLLVITPQRSPKFWATVTSHVGQTQTKPRS